MDGCVLVPVVDEGCRVVAEEVSNPVDMLLRGETDRVQLSYKWGFISPVSHFLLLALAVCGICGDGNPTRRSLFMHIKSPAR